MRFLLKSWEAALDLVSLGMGTFTVYLVNPFTGDVIDKQAFDNQSEAMILVSESRAKGYTVTTDFESLV